MFNKYSSDWNKIVKLEELEKDAKTKALMAKKNGNSLQILMSFSNRLKTRIKI